MVIGDVRDQLILDSIPKKNMTWRITEDTAKTVCYTLLNTVLSMGCVQWQCTKQFKDSLLQGVESHAEK